MKKDNVAGQGGSPASSPKGESGRSSVFSNRQRQKRDRSITTLAAALADVMRLLKQEGWIDILEDEFPELSQPVRLADSGSSEPAEGGES